MTPQAARRGRGVPVGLGEPADLRAWRRERVARAADVRVSGSVAERDARPPDALVARAMKGSTAHAFAKGDGGRVALRVAGAALPTIGVETIMGNYVHLHELAADWLVIYCLPGAQTAEQASQAEDQREHRAYREHEALLARRQVRVASLSSEPRKLQIRAMLMDEVNHHMLLDPALVIADALGLPTLTDGAGRCYDRLTLIARKGIIEHVFYPLERGGRSPEQILTWLDVHGWRACIGEG
jgi:peroxiredoxin